MTSVPDAVQYPKIGLKENTPYRKFEFYFGRLPNYFQFEPGSVFVYSQVTDTAVNVIFFSF